MPKARERVIPTIPEETVKIVRQEFARLGALAANQKRTPAQRRRLARHAVSVRWKRYYAKRGAIK
jgi:hypothetical protein